MDCNTPLEPIIDHCLDIGINCLAISDHNTIAGALKLQKIAPFKVIVAEEIKTSMGELMGLFIREEVPKGLSPEKTITQIRKQGGLVGIPHPFGRHLPLPLRGERRNLLSPAILPQVDIIEVFNSRNLFPNSSSNARSLAAKYGKVASAGSDAHTLAEIGWAYVEMPEFSGPDDFLDSLSQGIVFGHRSSPLVHLASTWAKMRKGFC